EQKAAGLAAKAERDAQKAAELAAAEEEARAAAAAAEAAAEEAFLELPRLADDAASEEEAEPALEPFALDEPDFEVDYRLWLIEYADGSTRTFDSHAGTLA
ncbi:MAG: hypothetical protein ACLSIH_14200, partial [Eggerthella lenta]